MLRCLGLIPAHAGKTGRPARPQGQRRAHPRSRGENDGTTRFNVDSTGSSPLTRGKPTVAAAPHRRRRLIPAHAGKTIRIKSICSHVRAHPRSRGENRGVRFHRATGRGSSPLTRGKLMLVRCGCLVAWLIPAHAGKTLGHASVATTQRAHPRSRGENIRAVMRCAGRRGSSPLTRGKRETNPRGLGFGGLIPAHAGKTRSGQALQVSWWAHPRSRGENVNPWFTERGYEGSSPLTRGKQLAVLLHTSQVGLIPAHAGKTPAIRPPITRFRAHPRSRGENATVSAIALMRAGSSPLTRGKLPPKEVRELRSRLIPAHAGKTESQASALALSRAHPRSRGENILTGY